MRRTSLLLLLLTLLHGLATAATDSLVTRRLSSTHGDLPCDETAVMLQDRDGFVWIGTRLGLYRYDGYALQTYRNDIDHPHRFTSCDVRQLAEDSVGGIWMGTFRGVNRIDKRTGEVLCFNGGDSVPSGFTKRLLCDSDGTIRVHTDRGWYAYADGRWQRTPVPAAPLPPGSSRMLRDRDGATWRCLPFGGVELTMPRRSPFANTRLRDTTDAVRALAVGADGTLWVGAERGVVGGNLPPVQVNALCPLPDGRIAVGTERDGLYLCAADGTVREHYDRTTPWLGDNCVYSLLVAADGRLLVGTWAGLSVLTSDGRGSYVAAADTTDLRHTHVLSITQTGTDDYWLGLIGGILHLTGPLTTPSRTHAYIYTYVDQPATTPTNAALAADTDEPGNPRYRIGGIYRILRDSHGDLWACTSEPGLLRYDARRDAFCCVSRQLGISGDNVRSIEEDADGRLWMLTNCGLACLDAPQPDGERPLHLYTVRHGLPRNYYGNAVSLTLPDGRICIAAGSDLTVFTPSAAAQHGPVPRRCLVTDIAVQGLSLRDMEPRAWQRMADALPPYTRHVTLPPGRNALGISFSTLNFVDPEAVQFAYRLEGIETEWVHPQAGTSTVRYANLPPGTYTFRVRTTEGAEEAQLRITVLPPLWRRWWAWLVYVLMAVAAAVYVRHRWLLRRERQEMQRLMAIERERNEELSAIVAQFQRQQGQPAPTGEEVAEAISSYDADFLRRCDEVIRQNISNPEFDQQALIAAVGTSHSTLYRKLKTLCGIDATTYIRRFRIQAACEMMRRRPGLRVAELADAVGFSSSKYFATCFRREMGCTPTEWIAKGCQALFLLLFLSTTLHLQAQTALHIGTDEGMPAEHVACLTEDAQGMLWAGTDEGLVGYDGTGFEHYTTENSGLTGNGFSAIWADTLHHQLWLGLKSGLAVMDLHTRRIRPVEIPGFYNIVDLAPAADGGLWVLNTEDRFAHIDLLDDCAISRFDGHPTSRNRQIVNRQIVKSYEMSSFPGLHRRPTVIRDLGDGHLSLESPVGIWNVDLTAHTAERQPMPEGWDEWLHRLHLRDHCGNLWTGTAQGLMCQPHRRSEFQLIEDAAGTAFATLTDSAGAATLVHAQTLAPAGTDVYVFLLWHARQLVGTSDGVYELKEEQLHRLEGINRALPSHYIFALAEDAQGKLWVGIYGSGIQIFDTEGHHVQSLNPRDTIAGQPPFPSGAIAHLLRDTKGRMWAATLEGVIRFDDTRRPTAYRTYTPADGLPTLYIRAIGEDGDGRIWVTTNQGLARWDEATDQFCTYRRPEGLPERPFYNGAIALLPDGRMAAASEGGITIFDPRAAAEPKPLPPLRLMSFRRLCTTDGGRAEWAFVPDDSLSFAHRDNTFTLTFGLADAALSGMVEYAYRVGSAGGQWISLGERPQLTLHSLPPGSYIVEMRARLTGQPWTDTATCAVRFRVRPPWWQTWWAYTLYALLVATAIFVYLRAYRRRLDLENNLRYAQSVIEELRRKEIIALADPPPTPPVREGRVGAMTASRKPEDSPPLWEGAGGGSAGGESPFIDKLSRTIFEHLDNPELDIDLLCDRMAMSRSTLYRKVKSLLGMSANEYIRWVRLGEAARRIAHGDLSEQTIAAVAADCGFSSLSYFRSCFKERFGVTPSEYACGKQ